MKKSNSSTVNQSSGWNYPNAVIASIAVLTGMIIVLMPFHATLTVWGSQLVGHYTLLRLWKECVLVLLGFGSLYTICTQLQLRQRFFGSTLVRLVAVFLAVQVVWGIMALITHHVTAKALGYGWVSDTRYLVFFLLVWVIASKVPRLYELWPKLVFWPAAAVIVFGLVQYFVLPYDFMMHLGYSAATIFPYEDINHNTHYIRIMSTLRGANPLGAYLVMVLSLLGAVGLKQKIWRGVLKPANRMRALRFGVFALAAVIALILTFSRSAWIGFIVSSSVLLWASLSSEKARELIFIGVMACVVLAAGAAFALRNDVTFQNVFLHTQTNSAVATTSNEGHASALQNGLHDLLHEPLGRGPGTAGPASAYNTGHNARIAENYFIQIAQETGWIGLALFVAINLLVAKELWARRSKALSLGLLAGLAGISFIGLLGHVWADDTIAYIWWSLAGLTLAVTSTRVDGLQAKH